MLAGQAPTRIESRPRWKPATVGEAVPSPLFATHTVLASTAIPAGRNPTAIGLSEGPVSSSIRTTVPSPVFATQTPLAPEAMALGWTPTWTVSTTWPDFKLTRDTV